MADLVLFPLVWHENKEATVVEYGIREASIQCGFRRARKVEIASWHSCTYQQGKLYKYRATLA